jgi:hypothetical protein
LDGGYSVSETDDDATSAMNDILSHNSFNPRGMANGGSAFGVYSPANVGSP